MKARPKAKHECAKNATLPLSGKDDEGWILYVLRCSDGSLYCGITNNLERRVDQHNAGLGARYTRGRGPVQLARFWPCSGRSEASKSEAAFKKLTRKQKCERIADAKIPCS